MEKTVTKEEVERVFLNNFPIIDRIKLKKSLNELFHPEFKVGDWVVGWHNNREGLRDNAWQIESFDKLYLMVKKDTEQLLSVYATPHPKR